MGDAEGWSAERVGEWMETINCSEFRRRFEENQINGKLLLSLTSEDLRGLGMKYGKQIHFAKSINYLLCSQRNFKNKIKMIETHYQKYDRDGDGFVTIKEFLKGWKRLFSSPDDEVEAILRRHFKSLDENDDDKVAISKLVDIPHMLENEFDHIRHAPTKSPRSQTVFGVLDAATCNASKITAPKE